MYKIKSTIGIVKKIALFILFFIAIIPIAAYLALQVPALQTYAAKRAAHSISKKIDAKIEIGKVYYIFFNKLIAKEVSVVTQESDTLLNAGKLSLKIDPAALLKGKLRIGHLRLENGGFYIINESDSTTNIDRVFGSVGEGGGSNVATYPIYPDTKAFELSLSKFRFSMENPYSSSYHRDSGINFSNLMVYDIELEVKDITLSGDSIMASVKNLSFKEKSGYKIDKISSKVLLAPGGVWMKEFSLQDGFSTLNTPVFNMTYSAPNAFSNFINDVSFDANFIESTVSFKTIAAFVPTLSNNNLIINLDGRVEGPVSSLRTKGLVVTSESGLTHLELDARISGLPNTNETMLFADIKNSTTTTNDLAFIISSINSSDPIPTLKNFSPLIGYSFKGRIAGLLDDFVANGTLSSNIGEIYIDLLMKSHSQTGGGVELNGHVESKEFNVGKLISSNSIGEVTMEGGMSLMLMDSEKGGAQFYLDSLNIKQLEFNNYSYKNILAVGSYKSDYFDGKIICRDPNLDFIFQGLIGISPNEGSNSYYDFYADIIYADLAALNFDKRDSLSALSFTTMVNFTQNGVGDIEGTINIRDMNFENSKGIFPIGNISVQSTSLQDNFTLFLRSSFANATYRGGNFITAFAEEVTNLSLNRHLDALFTNSNEGAGDTTNYRYALNIEFNDTRSVAELLFPGFFISAGSEISAEIDNSKNLYIRVVSEEIKYKNSFANNLYLNLLGEEKRLSASVTSDVIHFAGFSLDSSKVSLDASDNLVRVKSEYANKGELRNMLDFMTDIKFTRDSYDNSLITDITIYPSELYLNSQNWRFSGSKVVNQDSTFVFHNFYLYSGEQYLNIDGMISSNPYDTVTISLNKLELTPFNLLLGTEGLNIEGFLSGELYGVDLYNEPNIFIDLHGEELVVHNNLLGEVDIYSLWDNSQKHFDIRVSNRLDGRAPFDIEGIYKPSEEYLYATALLDNMSVSYFEPFFNGIFSKMEGGITGSLELEGELDKLVLTSNNAEAKEFSFTVDFTNVNYTLNGPLSVTQDGIFFNTLSVRDRLGNSGVVTGGIGYRYFNNLFLNTIVQFENMEVLNTTESDNSDFYGQAYVTGNLSIVGPLDRIAMEASVTANKNTSIHIPLSSATDVARGNLLTFVSSHSRELDSNGFPIGSTPHSNSQFRVNLKANMTPEAAMHIEIDKSVGDIITGYGSGLITLEINPARDIFSIQGDYTIHSGSYKFVLQGFLERDFTIQEGGNIGFNGDINKTNLNLTANYRTKAAINTLIADTSSVASRRTVDCQINMSGQLMNPRLGFNIDIPDIDPITKARVSAALNTEDKVVRQVISILVSGSFIPDVQSSIVNNSTLLYSNATEVLSNQINKIFTQLDIPLDLSFNYQPGQNGRDMFDAAISAQLFNNRVIVNGNIGSAKYMDRSSDVVGDLDVEIKLDDRGRFRAKAFSHSADQYSNYLDNSQRNGVGLVYQEEFSSFKELINSLFSNRRRERKRTERAKAEEESIELPL